MKLVARLEAHQVAAALAIDQQGVVIGLEGHVDCRKATVTGRRG
jgi:hypothetical protein